MNRITYENQGNNTYLVYEIAENDVIDNLSLGMINNNRIPGLYFCYFWMTISS